MRSEKIQFIFHFISINKRGQVNGKFVCLIFFFFLYVILLQSLSLCMDVCTVYNCTWTQCLPKRPRSIGLRAREGWARARFDPLREGSDRLQVLQLGFVAVGSRVLRLVGAVHRLDRLGHDQPMALSIAAKRKQTFC